MSMGLVASGAGSVDFPSGGIPPTAHGEGESSPSEDGRHRRSGDVDVIVFAFGHTDVRVSGDLSKAPTRPDPLVSGRHQVDARRWGHMLDEHLSSTLAEVAAADVRLPKLEPILRRIAADSGAEATVNIVVVATDQAGTGSGFEHTDTITLAPFLFAVLPWIARRYGLHVDDCSMVRVGGDPTSPAVCWSGADQIIERVAALDEIRMVHLCLVGGTPALTTAIAIRFSLADAAYDLPRISSWRVRDGRAEPDELPALLDTAIHRRDLRAMAENGRFADVAAALRATPGVGLEEAAALAELSDALVSLDISRALGSAPPDLRGTLKALRMPESREASASSGSATGDIRALVGLILAVIEIRWSTGEHDASLALAHLVAEYGGHLAWQPVLGHALDPVRLRRHVDVGKSLYGVDDPKCQIARGGYATTWARAVRRGEFGEDGGFTDAMASAYARIGSDFLVCGNRQRVEPRDWPTVPWFCTRDCAVWTGVDREEQPGLVGRVLAASLFRVSPLMQLRHRSPYAHFFTVPGPEDIESGVNATMRGIGEALDRVAWSVATDQPELWRELAGAVDPGDLPSVVEAVARFVSGDDALRAGSVIADVRRRLVAAIDRAEADDPRDRTR